MKKKAGGIKASLTRKIGPLPVWAWAGLLFVGIWYYRNKLSAQSGTGTGSVTPTPPTPQPDTVLQPGESVYDPNTGTLTTAPGGGGGDGSGNTPTTPPDWWTNPPDWWSNPPSTPPGSPDSPASPSPQPPSTRKKRTRKRDTKRTPKGKRQHGRKKKTTGKKLAGLLGKQRARSGSNLRNPVGGRTRSYNRAGALILRNRTRYRGTAKNAQARVSSRSTHPVVGQGTVRQRPVANASPRTAPRSTVQPSVHRPPSPRTTRTHTGGGNRRRRGR